MSDHTPPGGPAPVRPRRITDPVELAAHRERHWRDFKLDCLRRQRVDEINALINRTPLRAPPHIAAALDSVVNAWCTWEAELEWQWQKHTDSLTDRFGLIDDIEGGWERVPVEQPGYKFALAELVRIGAAVEVVAAPAVECFERAEVDLLAVAPPDPFTPCVAPLRGLRDAVRGRSPDLGWVKRARTGVLRAMSAARGPNDATDGEEGWHLPSAVMLMRE